MGLLIFRQHKKNRIEMMFQALKGRNTIAKGEALGLGQWNSKGVLGFRV